MNPSALRSRAVAPALVACALFWLAGCAFPPVGERTAAPQYVVGDHWQYRLTDNLHRGALSQLDAEVIAVSGHAARIRFDLTDTSGHAEWTDEVDGEGGLRSGSLWIGPPRSFNPPLQSLVFPLEPGRTWRQVIDTLRTDTELTDQILVYGRVQGADPTSVPAGRFDAVYVYRILQFDDEEFWRTRTIRREAVWYAPEAKGPVREAREATYTEKGGPDPATVRTESTVLELESFRAGGK